MMNYLDNWRKIKLLFLNYIFKIAKVVKMSG